MKTVGEVLKTARKKRGKSIAQIAKETKIKEKFLSALEKNDYHSLPGLPVALGFAKNYAQVVGVDTHLARALLRRDFPQTESPRKSVEVALLPKTFWTPRTTIIVAALGTVLILGFYLAKQYVLFAAPPPLEVTKVQAADGKLEIIGKTTPAATVEINGRTVLVEEDGTFHYSSNLPDSGAVEIEAKSRTGKKTTITKSIASP